MKQDYMKYYHTCNWAAIIGLMLLGDKTLVLQLSQSLVQVAVAVEVEVEQHSSENERNVFSAGG